VQVIADVAERVFAGADGHAPPIDWNSMRRHGRIREAIGRIIPGYEAIGEIDRTGKEFQIAGRTLHAPRFNTPSGRARFHACSIPPLVGSDEGRLRLMTLRSEGQFNTVVYEDEDIYRGQERRDVIMMHPSDIARLGLRVDQRVTVRSDTGALANVLVREIDIRPGNVAMYYPEANVLVPRVADPSSRTPAFKSVAVTVSPESPRPEVVPSSSGLVELQRSF
jgi:anaerobic selenocysteine-containing dehydrogenase